MSVPNPRGVVIKLRLLAGVLAGAAVTTWAVISITYAVSPNGGQVDDNYIGAGHLALLVDDSTQQQGINMAGLVPGQQRTTDQLVSANIGGVSAAALTLTVFGPNGGSPYAHGIDLRVESSDPAPLDDITRSSEHCTAPDGYVHSHSEPIPSTSSHLTYSLGTLTPGYGVCVRFQVRVNSNSGNSLQTKTAALRFSYHLEQTAGGDR